MEWKWSIPNSTNYSQSKRIHQEEQLQEEQLQEEQLQVSSCNKNTTILNQINDLFSL